MSGIEIDIAPLQQMARRIEQLGAKADTAARIAINDGARFAVRSGTKDIASQINLTQRYISGGQNPRLGVSQFASATNLEATVTGRDRPTSLARFSRSSVRFGRQRLSPTVKVDKGAGGGRVKGSFFVKLRRGTQMDGESYNVGLAVRLKPGERIPGKRVMAKPGRSGFYLLYGPSVGQAFRSAAPRAAGPVSDRVSNAFARALALDLKR